MRAGLDYRLAEIVPEHTTVPSDADLYAEMLPHANYLARSLYLADPEGAAADALIDVILHRRYQDRWQPGKARVTVYLYSMVHNRLRDALRSQLRRARWETEAVAQGSLDSDTYLGEYEDDGYVAEAELCQDDPHLSEVETLVALEQLRSEVAKDPFFSELLDVVAGRALANESVSNQAVGDALGVSAWMAGDRVRTLRELAAAHLGG